uniref:Uncharacterized protein n=1 Tax=Opuntia streptacantha TaxID=393608 RepID=A0A7C9CV80_OPUST
MIPAHIRYCKPQHVFYFSTLLFTCFSSSPASPLRCFSSLSHTNTNPRPFVAASRSFPPAVSFSRPCLSASESSCRCRTASFVLQRSVGNVQPSPLSARQISAGLAVDSPPVVSFILPLPVLIISCPTEALIGYHLPLPPPVPLFPLPLKPCLK